MDHSRFSICRNASPRPGTNPLHLEEEEEEEEEAKWTR